ncbi:MAG: hypothetical protein F6K44_24535, partial [Moorea sp. SIO3E2]|nr:hypothetical protein [Moorena sp. SIO3E2]
SYPNLEQATIHPDGVSIAGIGMNGCLFKVWIGIRVGIVIIFVPCSADPLFPVPCSLFPLKQNTVS